MAPLLARTPITYCGQIFEVGAELPTEPMVWNGRERPLDFDRLVARGAACDPDTCEDPRCEIHGEHAGEVTVEITPPADDEDQARTAPAATTDTTTDTTVEQLVDANTKKQLEQLAKDAGLTVQGNKQVLAAAIVAARAEG